MRKVLVSVSRTYDVWVGEGLLSQAGERVASVCGGEAAMLIADDAVNTLYGDIVENSLQAAGYVTTRFIFPQGEQSKNIEIFSAVLRALAKAKMTRSDVIVALGGGVTGDMAGFAAATYLRGIAFVQIPTTLLAMVDSSVGGKAAVDLPEGKNLAGAFYQPSLVLCDINTLKTLPEETFQDGCAEMIKHGVISDPELFSLLKSSILPDMEDLIARNIIIKRDIVAVDERDNGMRQILNFGHTIGHGVEKYSGYTITHGKAVAIGMVIASRGAFRIGVCGEDCHRDILETVRHHKLPDKTTLTPKQLIEAASLDKKRRGKQITLILPERIGKCITRDFAPAAFEEFIRLGLLE